MTLDVAACRSEICHMKKLVAMLLGVVLLFFSATAIRAQAPVASAPVGSALSPDQLDQLVGPIALYPDPLIAEILPVSGVTLTCQWSLQDVITQRLSDWIERCA